MSLSTWSEISQAPLGAEKASYLRVSTRQQPQISPAIVDGAAGDLLQYRVQIVYVVIQKRIGLVERLQADEAPLDRFTQGDRSEDNGLDLALGQFLASAGLQ